LIAVDTINRIIIEETLHIPPQQPDTAEEAVLRNQIKTDLAKMDNTEIQLLGD